MGTPKKSSRTYTHNKKKSKEKEKNTQRKEKLFARERHAARRRVFVLAA